MNTKLAADETGRIGQFRLSHLLLLMVTIGIALGWWHDHRQLSIELVQFSAALSEADELMAEHQIWMRDAESNHKLEREALLLQLDEQRRTFQQQIETLRTQSNKERDELLSLITDLTMAGAPQDP